MTKPMLPALSDLDLTTVTGGAGIPSTAAARQRAFAKKIMSQPFPSTGFPGLGF